MAEAYVQPFTALAIRHSGASGQLGRRHGYVLRARVDGGRTGTSCRSTADELTATGCSDGLFEKLDWSTIGGKDHYQPLAVSDCGVGAFLHNAVLAWDRDKFQATPTWARLLGRGENSQANAAWREERPRGALEIALLADGVAPGDVYKTLASLGRRRSRVPQAGPAQALYRLVANRGRGGENPGFRRRADDDDSQRAMIVTANRVRQS